MRLSDLERVLYPGEDVMKGDVLNYYYRMAETMLTHVRGRLALLRCWPDGIAGESYYRRLPDDRPVWITAPGPRPAPASAGQVVVDEPAVLAYMAEQTCITPFVSTSRVHAPERPDRIVFDVDPPRGLPHAFQGVCAAARLLRSVLGGLGHEAFVMTTGSRGLHVHVPILPGPDFESVDRFARHVVERACHLDPERVTAEPGDRGGARVRIGWDRNHEGGTSVAPYALRALPGAPVATPLAWEELGAPGTAPATWDLKSIFPRLARRGDPWSDIARRARPLLSSREASRAG